MPTKAEKDAVTGTEIRDHEWDGIRELNTPLPKWWAYTFYFTIAASIVYFVLFPAVPFVTGYTKGVLGYSTRAVLETQLDEARAAQAQFTDRIAEASLAEIQQSPDLLNFALAGGRASFAENCAACHAQGGGGAVGFPSLADDDWLWGGTLEDIALTITHGVRLLDNFDSRVSEMPAYADLLSTEQIRDTAAFVHSLSRPAEDTAAAARGAATYANECAACHGDRGEGIRELGAPRLADAIWLYGGELDEIAAQIAAPRHGVMPAWQERLGETTVKMLTLYVHGLGGGE